MRRVEATGDELCELASLREELSARADAERAVGMARYMRDLFPFLGVASTDRKAAQRSFISNGRTATSAELIEGTKACWREPEREFQYVGCDLLRRWVARLDADAIGGIEWLIRTKSWWDTVDALAAHPLGGLVQRFPELGAEMDAWIEDDDLWIARAAILHQLRYRSATDADRLFRYVDRRCTDTDFFIRKACGWALREYAKVDPRAVRRYVDSRGDMLSGVTRREATRHLD